MGYRPTFNFSQSPVIGQVLADGTSKIRITTGPVGSGKSTAHCVDLMQIASSQPVEPGTDMRRSRFALIRNTSGELKTTTMKTWQECWPPEKTGPLRESSPMTHVISRPPRNGQPGIEAEFMFIPLDKPKDVRHLRSLDLTAAWCNEASELPPAIIQMLRTRVGRFPRRQGDFEAHRATILCDTNAVDHDHWLATKELERPEGWAFYRQPPAVLDVIPHQDGQWLCTEQDERFAGRIIPGHAMKAAGKFWIVNPQAENINNLGKNYYAETISGASEAWIRRFLQSRTGFLQEGKPVIPSYDDRACSADFPVLEGLPLMIGADVGGGTLQPAAVIGQYHPAGVWLIHYEMYASDMGLSRFATELKRLIGTVPGFGQTIQIGKAYGDPAGAKRDELFETVIFDHLRNDGIPIEPAPSNEPAMRIQAIENALGRRVTTEYGQAGLLVHSRCRMLRKALSGGWHYKRVQVSGEERFHDKPNKNHPYSDLGDALGYLTLGGGEYRSMRGLLPAGQTWEKNGGVLSLDFDVFSQ
jgi:hypothetical protein